MRDCPLDALSSVCTPLRKRGRPSRDDSAMPREAILQKAFEAFARQGYEGVSLRQLAKECGVSDSLLSHHFGSKQQLWFEAADSVFMPLYLRLIQTLEGMEAPNVAWQLRGNLKASLSMMALEAETIAFMFREGEGDTERAEHLRTHYLIPYTQRIHALVDEATAQGLMRKLSHEACTGMVLGIMRMLVVPGLYKPALAPRLATAETISAYVDEIVTIFYDGLMLPASQHQASDTPSTNTTPTGSRS
ncbi:MAG: TetR/AcrR family transcriptional regulator [Pedobacter sp.]|nr:TetR/AcrR family transcriptional regulator [Pedobacter sp.]